MSGPPLVSVVTPFYNTAAYLRECIESVLAQTYPHFEYLLVDNLSTDGSGALAAEYAARDPRIRLLRNDVFVGQVPNYNGALRRVSPEARYVKIVQADDVIFPECLERMVAVGEAYPSTAIISSYYLVGPDLGGSGAPWPAQCIKGRDACRMHLLHGRFLFGSPTTVLYRATLLKKREPFYSETALHEDTELCYEVLESADLGFVHQVLSYQRVGNSGILSAVETYHWQQLDTYIIVRKFGPRFLSAAEFNRRFGRVSRYYRQLLGEGLLFRREPAFWDYHRRGLATIGETLPSRARLAWPAVRGAVKALLRRDWAAEEIRQRQARRAATGKGATGSGEVIGR